MIIIGIVPGGCIMMDTIGMTIITIMLPKRNRRSGNVMPPNFATIHEKSRKITKREQSNPKTSRILQTMIKNPKESIGVETHVKC
jgi:hypothetical protein